ncbi:DUF6879 family protein [Actinocorallia sp. A-T 12471]|uniref:DUF6879 family protein n=1 Tax=Actinocorallia sp. A-T 12471 TaxID=3089813 RepID=UPI0029CB45CB|nr:DUF6879 family protein [Actinocorallia sp. A-T 12471]MDX6740491.1 hypothetical protein [Actinocorallia sp. A-T 12471]
MELISVERRSELLRTARSIRKMELRDNYSIDAEIFAAWREGRSIAATAKGMADRAAERIAAGVVTHRVKVVSEPLSSYHKFILAASEPMIKAGEVMRWLPRRLASTVFLPGNDFFVLDGEAVIFNVFDGEDQRAEIQLTQDPAVVDRCTAAFTSAWELALPYDEYRADSRAGRV